MRCDELRESLLQARYARVEPQADALAHLRECVACRSFADAQTRLDHVLAHGEQVSAGPGFDTRFFAQLAEAKARARRPLRGRLWWTLVPTLAAAAAAAMILWPKPAQDFVPREDLALATELELVEELPVVQHLDEAEAFEVLAEVDVSELEAVTKETPP
ncbi:MAG TPA: hypothetical protein VF331_25170 [Polyangiales bacterium]